MVNKKLTEASSRPATPSARKAAPPAGRRASQPTPAAQPKAAPQRAATVEQPSRLDGVRRLVRETVAELRKVQWPDRITTRNLTLVVIAMSAALALLLGALDAVLTRLIEWLIQF